GLHIGRQPLEFISNAIVEQFYDPSHQLVLLHFCNIAERMRRRGDLEWRARLPEFGYDNELSISCWHSAGIDDEAACTLITVVDFSPGCWAPHARAHRFWRAQRSSPHALIRSTRQRALACHSAQFRDT